MFETRTSLSPEIRLRDLFASRPVQRGEVVRRKRRDIDRYVGIDRFLQELEARGFRAVENRGQVVIFCNRAPIRRLR